MFAAQFRKIEEKPSKVAAWSGDAFGPPVCNGIAFQTIATIGIVLVALTKAWIAYGPAAKMTSQLRATNSLANSPIRSSISPAKRVSTTIL